MKKYIIVREDYYNEKGVTKRTNFCIKESKKFLWFKWWSYVKYKECYESGCYNSVLNFNNLYEAEKFVEDVLFKNGPRDKWSSFVLKEMIKK